MHIDIPGAINDYFTVSGSEEKTYKSNRSRIRALVEIRDQKIQQVIADGGNIHTASLDLQDQVSDFFSEAPVEAQVVLFETLAEEMLASASAINDETTKLNAQVASSEATGHAIGQWIGAGILLVFLLFMFGLLK
ncbi:hypothetical protein OUHCRE2_48300 [Enterobacter asburiae]|uniref:hypothetical protein n=1 Tax=Enterobacter cloacae complex TaxID=354276 RepID=UPI00079BA59C|nr:MULTISPECIES: hypothetical protein [Enterobacter cloacae complex]SAH96242.1 Uncharacterised protein [Enterobacter hormaechei]HDT1963431.1 hypothetical protein [Enterobacter asburiae]